MHWKARNLGESWRGEREGTSPSYDGKNTTINIKVSESSDPIAAVLGLEYHHPIMNTLWGHGGWSNRQIYIIDVVPDKVIWTVN